MTYDKYFTVQESEQFTFYRVPKALAGSASLKTEEASWEGNEEMIKRLLGLI